MRCAASSFEASAGAAAEHGRAGGADEASGGDRSAGREGGGSVRTVEVNAIRSDGSRSHLVQVNESHVDRDDPDTVLGINVATQVAEGLGVPVLEHH